ncbi:hypothetical protein VYF65_004525 [Lysinibacillus irui]|uniref:hypothetical protein n=1 Tax=Lysinibacillus irui TaxID=2998077 RepID=UPI0038897728
MKQMDWNIVNVLNEIILECGMDHKLMSKYLSYIVYFVIGLILTYCMQWVTVLFMGSVRFTAADSYPGDLSTLSLVVWSFLFSISHFVVLTIFSFLYKFLVSVFNIKFQTKIALMFHAFVTGCLIMYFINVFLH